MSGPTPGGAGRPPPESNGLPALRYVPLMDVMPQLGDVLLAALARARIAAYLDQSPDHPKGRRLFVAAEERSDARTIVASVIRATGGTPPPIPGEDSAGNAGQDRTVSEQTEDAIDYEAAFADLIADWHVDTLSAIRDHERALSREDAQWRDRLERSPAENGELAWLDEQHYVPPPPPPWPRLALPTFVALVLLLASIALLVFGAHLALPTQFVMLLGVGGVVLSSAILVSRLRERHDDDDDGAVI